jgi:hypothetical protein
MARPRSSVRPVVVTIKFTLLPGLHDRYITYFQSIAPGHRAQTVLRDLDNGMARTLGQGDDTLADRLANLIG